MGTCPRITEWDWRYRVGFDSSLHNAVHRTARSHATPAEAEILDGILDWASGFVSLDALLTAVEKQPRDSMPLLASVDERKLLPVPRALDAYFAKRLDTASARLLAPARRRLASLLEAARGAPFPNHHRPVFEITLGSELDELLSEAACVPAKRRPESRALHVRESRKFVHHFLRRLRADRGVRDRFGAVDLAPFEVEIRPGPGFAEYWPAELRSGAGTDQLVIFENQDSLRAGDLCVSLAHELAPGHGLFFQRARRQPGLVDYGAMSLIEGWATFCEWHALADPHSSFARASRLALLRFLDRSDHEVAAEIFAEVCRQGYSQSLGLRALLHHFQYPAYEFSYSLGALWLERRSERIKPVEFLEFLESRSWGDFFSTWPV